MRPTDLIDELDRERDAFFEVLSAITPDSLTTPGLVGEWSGRELIAHLGYWTGRATETIHAVEQGRIDELADAPDTDEINETVARVARSTPLDTVRRREAASVEALIERLRGVDPGLLDVALPDGTVLSEAVREDGTAHYAEHAAELRRTLNEAPRG